MSLTGRVAVVTGAARGIGAAIARRLAAEGAKTALLDRDLPGARRTAAEVGGTAFGCDVSRARQVSAVFGDLSRSLGPVDILVNNAGIWRHTPVLEAAQRDWDQVFGVNVKGVLLCAQAAAAAAALSLTLALADALAASGVQVHAVCPGATRTELLQQIEAEEPGSQFDWVHDPAEVADQVLGLLVPWEQAGTGRVVTMKPVGNALGLPTAPQGG